MRSGYEGSGSPAWVSSGPNEAARGKLLRHYTFVDYATQGYMGLVGVLIVLFHNATVPHWQWLVAAHAAGVLLVHGLIQFGARTSAWVAQGRLGAQTAGLVQFIRHFYPVPLYLWFFGETGWLNRMFFRQYLDPVIIDWDQKLFGCQPSLVFMQKLPYLAVSELFYAAYFSYYVMIVGLGVALYLRNRQQFFHYISVVSFVFYICYALYILLPIIGPPIFLRDVSGYHLPDAYRGLVPVPAYPAAVEAGPVFKLMGFIYRVFEAPGAALPSSHVAIALCTVFFSFLYLRPIRFVHLAVAILLCLATIYCRYHYAVDVITGAATSALLVPLGNWLYFKIDKPQAPGQRVPCA